MAVVDGGKRLITSEAMEALRLFSHGIDSLVLAFAQRMVEDRPETEDITADDIHRAAKALREFLAHMRSNPDASKDDKLAADVISSHLNKALHDAR